MIYLISGFDSAQFVYLQTPVLQRKIKFRFSFYPWFSDVSEKIIITFEFRAILQAFWKRDFRN